MVLKDLVANCKVGVADIVMLCILENIHAQLDTTSISVLPINNIASLIHKTKLHDVRKNDKWR